MTVASTTTRELTIGTIVKRSLQLAGLLSAQQDPQVDDAALGRDLLEALIDNLQTEGIFARSVKFRDVSLTVGVYRYTLTQDVLDVIGDGMYIMAGETDATKADGETVVKQIRREEWHRLSTKAAQGRPTLFYCHRELSSVQVWFWPIPADAPVSGIPAKVRLQLHRLLADNNDANATPDLQRYWVSYMQWQLAHDLGSAKGLPIERLAYMAGQAKSYLDKCRGYANQRPGARAYIDHRTPWSR